MLTHAASLVYLVQEAKSSLTNSCACALSRSCRVWKRIALLPCQATCDAGHRAPLQALSCDKHADSCCCVLPAGCTRSHLDATRADKLGCTQGWTLLSDTVQQHQSAGRR